MLRRRCLTGFCALAGLNMLPRAVQAEGMLSRASEDVQVPVYDVVVVGTGLAGHCAALSAKLAGAQRVMMIDKAPLVGGHSALASGSIAFVDEKRQAAQGIVDSVDKFVADARVTGGSIDEELVRFIAENPVKDSIGCKRKACVFAEYFPRLRWYASSMRYSVRKHGSPTLYLPIA